MVLTPYRVDAHLLVNLSVFMEITLFIESQILNLNNFQLVSGHRVRFMMGLSYSTSSNTIQEICPRFKTRTPYIIIILSSSLSIWLTVIILLCNVENMSHKKIRFEMKEKKNHDKNTHKPAYKAIELPGMPHHVLIFYFYICNG